MKIRDLVLLLAGGGLVVFGMVVGDLLENDAFADDHAKTELSELELKQKVKSAESKIINFSEAEFWELSLTSVAIRDRLFGEHSRKL